MHRRLPPDVRHTHHQQVLRDFSAGITAALARCTPSVGNMHLYVTDCNMAATLLAPLGAEGEGAVEALRAFAFLKAAPLAVIEASLPRIEGRRAHEGGSGGVGGGDKMELATPVKAGRRGDAGGWGDVGIDGVLAASTRVKSDAAAPWGAGGEGLGEGAWGVVRGTVVKMLGGRPEVGGAVFPPMAEEDAARAARIKTWLAGRR